MHYLTVQDILWINLQITKKQQSFNYARLEEATFYQYAYGQSSSVLSQAARLLAGFSAKKPFANGSEATAFVATMAFLKLNGFDVHLSDESASHWVERASRDASAALQALTDITEEAGDHHGEPDVRDAVHEVIDAYPKTLALMSGRVLVGV